MIVASKSHAPYMVSSTLLGRLANRAQHYYPGTTEGVSEIVIESTKNRLCSVIQRVRFRWHDGNSFEIIAKISGNALYEFEALNTVWPRFKGHSKFRIPKPLDLLDDVNAVVMEVAYGTSLLTLLPRFIWTTANVESAEHYCRDAGEWLFFYHNVDRSKSETRSISQEASISGLSETLHNLRNEGFNKEICLYVETEIIPKAKGALHEPLPISMLHGDYKLDNILIGDNTITVLDLSGVTMGVSDRDVAAFLVSLLLLRLTRRVPYAVVERLRNAFIKAYYGKDKPPLKVLAFLQCAGIADVTLELIRRRRHRVVRLWVESVVKDIIMNLGEDEFA